MTSQSYQLSTALSVALLVCSVLVLVLLVVAGMKVLQVLMGVGQRMSGALTGSSAREAPKHPAQYDAHIPDSMLKEE